MQRRIRIMVDTGGKDARLVAGQIVSVPQEVGRRLVSRGKAVWVDDSGTPPPGSSDSMERRIPMTK